MFYTWLRTNSGASPMEVPLPDFQNVLFEPRDHLLYVTLNRPERRNAIDPQTSYELLQAFTAFKEDDSLWVAIVTGAGGTQRLPRAVPLAFAMELLLTGDRFDARTALRFGLVSRVVPADQLMATANEIAEKILECGPLAVRAVKQAALQGLTMTLEEGLKLESELTGKIFATEDAREGPTAFAQKRKPEYKGR